MLHRGVLAGQVDVAALREHRDRLEERWLAEEAALIAKGAGSEELRAFAARAAEEERAMVNALRPRSVGEAPTAYWRRKNAALEKLQA